MAEPEVVRPPRAEQYEQLLHMLADLLESDDLPAAANQVRAVIPYA